MKKLAFVIIAILMLTIFTTAYGASGNPGDTVTVTLSVISNSAAVSGKVEFSYDESALEYVSASAANGWVAPYSATGKYTIASAGELIPTGLIGTITFRIKDNAKAGTYAVSVSAKAVDKSAQSVSLGVSAENVTVDVKPAFLPGDCNNDGVVDGRDLLRLARFVVGQDVTLDEAAADLTGDGNIDGRDVLRLAKKLAGM